ncbi:MAG: hypothetical protein ACRD13_12980 [Terriglobales bacterium]
MEYKQPARQDLLDLIKTTPGANDGPFCGVQSDFAKSQLRRRAIGAANEAAPLLRKDAGERAAILAAAGNIPAAAITADSPLPVVDGNSGFVCQQCGANLGWNFGEVQIHNCVKAKPQLDSQAQLNVADPPPWRGPEQWGAPVPLTDYAPQPGQLEDFRDTGWRPAPGTHQHDPVRLDAKLTDREKAVAIAPAPLLAAWGAADQVVAAKKREAVVKAAAALRAAEQQRREVAASARGRLAARLDVPTSDVFTKLAAAVDRVAASYARTAAACGTLPGPVREFLR